jgi:hypothetical protein
VPKGSLASNPFYAMAVGAGARHGRASIVLGAVGSANESETCTPALMPALANRQVRADAPWLQAQLEDGLLTETSLSMYLPTESASED